MEEIFTTLSWRYLNIHQKPIGLLNTCHFYDFLLVFLEDAKRLGFTNQSAKEFSLLQPQRIVYLINSRRMNQQLIQSSQSWTGQIMNEVRNAKWICLLDFDDILCCAVNSPLIR